MLETQDDSDCPPPPEAPKKTVKERREMFDHLHISNKAGKLPYSDSPPQAEAQKMTIKERGEMFDRLYASKKPVKVVRPTVKQNENVQPPPIKPRKRIPPPRTHSLNETRWTELYKADMSWDDLCRDLKLRGAPVEAIILVKGEHLFKAIKNYEELMLNNESVLKQGITELKCTADNLDKVSKGTKIAGITGGASTVAGGVAAAVGVFLSPFTAGFSLALTVAGVGMATAGGVTGASAAIANKVSTVQDRTKMEKNIQHFEACYDEILSCLSFINKGFELLKYHGPDHFNEAKRKSEKLAIVVKLSESEASAMASETCSRTSGIIKGFAAGMDLYFSQGKNGQKPEKGFESKLAQKIRVLTKELNEGLEGLLKINAVFRRHIQ